jgi:ribulose-5-phosphate 4-epimerase/fuculose-1-phosphate aldolase
MIPGLEMATELREEVAEAAVVLARLGLVTAFGHVSARAGGAMLITPAADLAGVTADRVVEVPLGIREGPLPPGAPTEAWAHLALYRARPDAAAIARAQPPAAFAAAAAVSVMVPLHGQAAWLGESVPVYDDAALLRSAEQAERAARCLPDGEALLLRGNGGLTLGAAPGLAVARMWLLGAACDVYLKALAASGETPSGLRPSGETLSGLRPSRANPVTPLSAGEIASWRAVSGELLPRLWEHLRQRAGAGQTPSGLRPPAVGG